MSKIIKWIKKQVYWDYDDNYISMLKALEDSAKANYISMLKALEDSAKANWESNMKPRDFKDFETYREFFIGSHLLCFKVGAEIKD